MSKKTMPPVTPTKQWKLAIIGGSGRIACAVACELVRHVSLPPGEIKLFGRSADKIQRNLHLIDAVRPPGENKIKVNGTVELSEALAQADIVLYNATAGLNKSAGFSAWGIAQAGHILHIGQEITRLCPEAWFLVNTNPTDVPLLAVHLRFGLTRIAGLCNASDIFQKVLAAYLGCTENEISMEEYGVNHEVWYTDILRNHQSIYDQLRRSLPVDYDPANLKSQYLESFPEWPMAFRNNIAITAAIGYLGAPVGGPGRFRGLPVSGLMMKRPSDEDYLRLWRGNVTTEEILKVTRRCGGGIPVYISQVIAALAGGQPGQYSVQVLQNCRLDDQRKSILLQANCSIADGTITIPKVQTTEYLSALMASRIRQNILAARALAEQDGKLMCQALLVYPERVEIGLAEKIVAEQQTVKPYMQLS